MPADVDTLQQLISDMQSQLAFQDDAIRSLDEALAQQQQELLLLRRQFELLNERQREQETHSAAGALNVPGNEKPPHY
ncbi:MAG: SlyX family protein [Halioglobus sp.]